MLLRCGSTPAEAKAHAEKQAAGKVKKGYKEAKVKAVKKKTTKKKVAKKATKKKAVKKAPSKGMEITDLTVEQKKSFCRAMAVCGFYEETDSAYSNALYFLSIDEPRDEEFSYIDGIGASLYAEVEDAVTETLYLQLIFAALYNPEKFIEFARGNKGYAFALDMLGGLESIDSEEDFQYFLDSVVDA